MTKAITVSQPAGALPGQEYLKYLVQVDLDQFDFQAILRSITEKAWDGIDDDEAEELTILIAQNFDAAIDSIVVPDETEAAAALYVAGVIVGGLRRGVNFVVDRFGGQ